MRSDMETSELNQHRHRRARAPAQSVRWDFDFVRDEPPPVRRVQDSPMETSTPRAEVRTPNLRPSRALERPRPRATSAPPAEHPAKRVAVHYSPVKEEITPPVSPPRAHNVTPEHASIVVPETPSPVAKPGREQRKGNLARATEGNSSSRSRDAQSDASARDGRTRGKKKRRLLRPGGHPLLIYQRTLFILPERCRFVMRQ